MIYTVFFISKDYDDLWFVLGLQFVVMVDVFSRVRIL